VFVQWNYLFKFLNSVFQKDSPKARQDILLSYSWRRSNSTPLLFLLRNILPGVLWHFVYADLVGGWRETNRFSTSLSNRQNLWFVLTF